MPVVLVLCAVGAFADNNNLFDVWVMVAAGVLGYVMRALDYDPAPLVLGLSPRAGHGALAPPGAHDRARRARRPVGSPLSASMLLAAAATLVTPVLARLVTRRRRLVEQGRQEDR